MMRIYEVHTEDRFGKQLWTYRVAAQTFDAAIKRVQKKHINPDQQRDYKEYISEVRILASES
jgi:hypothetical protein